MLKRNGIISALCIIWFLVSEAPDISVAEALVLFSILFLCREFFLLFFINQLTGLFNFRKNY